MYPRIFQYIGICCDTIFAAEIDDFCNGLVFVRSQPDDTNVISTTKLTNLVYRVLMFFGIVEVAKISRISANALYYFAPNTANRLEYFLDLFGGFIAWKLYKTG